MSLSPRSHVKLLTAITAIEAIDIDKPRHFLLSISHRLIDKQEADPNGKD